MDRPLHTSRAAESADEHALIAACRGGQREGFDRFFRQYARIVERVLIRMVGPTPDLEDLLQITFVEAMRSFPRYRGEASLKTWVTRIAVHVALHQLRRGVRRTAPLELLPDEAEPVDEAARPDAVLDDRRLGARLHQLLDRIAPKKRVAFLLYTVEGHSIGEVASLTGAGQAATKSRIWFARRELVALARKDPALRAFAEALGAGGTP